MVKESGANEAHDASEERLQKKFMEFQVVEQQVKQLENAMQNLDTQLVEVKGMQKAVQEMGSIEAHSETFFPVANGIFAKGKITDTKELLVNVGSNVIVNKSVKETLGLLEKQAAELEGMRQQFIAELERNASKMRSMETELQKMVSGKRN